jgi:hypothetical protein
VSSLGNHLAVGSIAPNPERRSVASQKIAESSSRGEGSFAHAAYPHALSHGSRFHCHDSPPFVRIISRFSGASSFPFLHPLWTILRPLLQYPKKVTSNAPSSIKSVSAMATAARIMHCFFPQNTAGEDGPYTRNHRQTHFRRIRWIR